MAGIQGPQGTGSNFQKKLAALKAKYPNMSDVKARRIAAQEARTENKK